MYTLQRLVLMTLDPVHIGTGGYRLGRVDLSIAREPGTNLPKIPGTSLSGAARHYAANCYETPGCAGWDTVSDGEADDKERLPTCSNPADCPVCYTFGHVKGASGASAGRVSIGDAHLLLFPVHSTAGPVWVSTAQRLREAGFVVTGEPASNEGMKTTLPGYAGRPLNLGWLLLTVEGEVRIQPPAGLWGDSESQAWEAISERLVLVTPGLLGHIVNSNLEVRTSVRIDPRTGAAADKALFTYEALPRATWLCCDVVEDDYRPGRFPEAHPKAQGLGHKRPLDVVRKGLELAQYLGVGGMGTRGFGRIKLMGGWEVNHDQSG